MQGSILTAASMLAVLALARFASPPPPLSSSTPFKLAANNQLPSADVTEMWHQKGKEADEGAEFVTSWAASERAAR